MTEFKIITKNGASSGFEITGHTLIDEYGKDILCAAVSSAAYLVANTITDILQIEADVDISEGSMRLRTHDDSEETAHLIDGLLLHMQALQDEYPGHIKIIQR